MDSSVITKCGSIVCSRILAPLPNVVQRNSWNVSGGFLCPWGFQQISPSKGPCRNPLSYQTCPLGTFVQPHFCRKEWGNSFPSFGANSFPWGKNKTARLSLVLKKGTHGSCWYPAALKMRFQKSFSSLNYKILTKK